MADLDQHENALENETKDPESGDSLDLSNDLSSLSINGISEEQESQDFLMDNVWTIIVEASFFLFVDDHFSLAFHQWLFEAIKCEH